jgi:DNA-directed RNA polymerase specialized sigma24 family protein
VDNDETGSVTHWIAALRAGESAAAQPLWERFFERLVRRARARSVIPRRGGVIDDEEDSALSAFKSVCVGLAGGEFLELSDRDDLWRFLVVIARRKAINKARDAMRQKRGGGRVLRESEMDPPGDAQDDGGLDQLAGSDPSPEFLAIMAEECQRLMTLLDHPDLRLQEVANWKLEGLTRDEIADQLGCSRRTVAARLVLIRETWERSL